MKRDLSNIKSFDELTPQEIDEIVEALTILAELGKKAGLNDAEVKQIEDKKKVFKP